MIKKRLPPPPTYQIGLITTDHHLGLMWGLWSDGGANENWLFPRWDTMLYGLVPVFCAMCSLWSVLGVPCVLRYHGFCHLRTIVSCHLTSLALVNIPAIVFRHCLFVMVVILPQQCCYHGCVVLSFQSHVIGRTNTSIVLWISTDTIRRWYSAFKTRFANISVFMKITLAYCASCVLQGAT